MKRKLTRSILILFFVVSLLMSASGLVFASSIIETQAGVLLNGSYVNGVLSSVNDANVYQVNTLADGELRVTFENIKGRFYASISDQNGNNKTYVDSSSYTSTSMTANVKMGKYTIKVMPSGWSDSVSNGTYIIKASYASTPPAFDANFEPNDTSSNAYPLVSGVSYNSTLSSNVDVDWYKFTNEADGDVRITFENVKGRLYSTLYDGDGNSKTYTDTSSSSTSALQATLKKGTYYIQVYPSNWGDSITNGKYTIKATYPTATHKFDGNLEPNDTSSNAFALESGLPYNTTLSSNVDVDWYTFTNETDGDVRITFENVNGRLYSTLYDVNYNSKTYTDTSSSSTSAMQATLKKGTYYIQVYPNNWGDSITDSKYTIKATDPIIKPVVHDSNFEPNDIISASFHLQTDVGYESSLQSNVDVDWYSISTNQDGFVKLQIDKVKGGLYLKVFDESGKNVTYWNTSTDASGNISFAATKGKYYFQVFPYNWGDSRTEGTYRIKASYSPDNTIKVVLNSVNLKFEQPPVINNNSTLVPLRAIFEALDSIIKWDDVTKTVTATKGNITVTLTIGAKTAMLNDKTITLDSPAQIINGKTMVPIRFVSESLNADVKWDNENRSVIITTN